jgi:hypothetical protein
MSLINYLSSAPVGYMLGLPCPSITAFGGYSVSVGGASGQGDSARQTGSEGTCTKGVYTQAGQGDRGLFMLIGVPIGLWTFSHTFLDYVGRI